MGLAEVAMDVYYNSKSVAIVGEAGSGRTTVLKQLLTYLPQELTLLDLDEDAEQEHFHQLQVAYEHVDAESIVVVDHGGFSFGELLGFKYLGQALLFTAYPKDLAYAKQLADVTILTAYENGEYLVELAMVNQG